MPLRPTIRLRLTLAYGGLFLFAGVLLLAVNYILVRNSLDQDRFTVGVRAVQPPTFEVPGAQVPVPPEPFVIEGRPASPGELERRFRNATLSTLVVQSGQALAVMALASVGLGWMVAGRALRPVQDMSAKARRMSEQNLHERIDLQGPDDELKELADTFDGMLGRLDAAFQSQRRFVANASHELRTPLSIIRTEVDVALSDPDATAAELRATAQRVRDATQRSERLIDSLLVLAQSDRGMSTTGLVDLDEVVSEAAAQVAAEAAAAEVELALDVAPLRVLGDRHLLERLAGNLVENGIRYNHPGGRVEVSLFRVGSGGGSLAVLRVTNTGQPVPPDRMDDLFQPFRRLSGERTTGDRRGVGLGLSIVRSVATAHGGTVTARPRAEGGLEVEVRLPLHS